MGGEYSIHQQRWPGWDPSLILEVTQEMVVQVDGKMRDRIVTPVNATEETIEAMALERPNVIRHLDGRCIVRVVVIPGRIVNIVTESGN
jgi:leucyl-tRNA synthetase